MWRNNQSTVECRNPNVQNQENAESQRNAGLHFRRLDFGHSGRSVHSVCSDFGRWTSLDLFSYKKLYILKWSRLAKMSENLIIRSTSVKSIIQRSNIRTKSFVNRTFSKSEQFCCRNTLICPKSELVRISAFHCTMKHRNLDVRNWENDKIRTPKPRLAGPICIINNLL